MLCENYGYNFEVAMLEKIKVISNDKDAVASAVIREKWIGGI